MKWRKKGKEIEEEKFLKWKISFANSSQLSGLRIEHLELRH